MSRVRKTIAAFTDTAGNGAVGTVNLFTVTGTVYIDRFVAYCTTTLAGVGGVTCGSTTDVDAFGSIITASTWAIDEFWSAGNVVKGSINMARPTSGGANAGFAIDKCQSENIILGITGSAVTSGAAVFDVWYTPISDDATIVAA